MRNGAIELPLKPKNSDIGSVYIERESIKVKSDFNALQTFVETIAVSETMSIPLVRGRVARIAELDRSLEMMLGRQEVGIHNE